MGFGCLVTGFDSGGLVCYVLFDGFAVRGLLMFGFVLSCFVGVGVILISF